MKLEKNSDYAIFIMGLWWLIVLLGILTIFTDDHPVMDGVLKSIIAIVLMASAAFPLYIQLKSKRRLNWQWILCEHIEEDAVKYKTTVFLNVIVLAWFVWGGIYFVLQ